MSKNILIKVFVIAIIMCLPVGYVAIATHAEVPSAQDSYESAQTQVLDAREEVEKAQKVLEADLFDECLAGKNLASAKLTDYHNEKYELQEDEELGSLTEEYEIDCGLPLGNEDEEVATAASGGPIDPEDLYYTFARKDAISSSSISQSQREHFGRNGYMATDIATNGRYLELYAPSYEWMDDDGEIHDESREYTVKVVENWQTMGLTIELLWDNKSFAIGHLKEAWVSEGDIVKTGDKIGSSGGCPGDLQFNEVSSGCHIHFEYRIEDNATPYPEYTNSPHGEKLEALRKHRKKVVFL